MDIDSAGNDLSLVIFSTFIVLRGGWPWNSTAANTPMLDRRNMIAFAVYD
jgi:hypothetical protein